MSKVANANRLLYESPVIVDLFRSETGLCLGEKHILDSFKDEIKDQSLLEIGAGGGRITPSLFALTQDYIGIDCSRSMLEAARKQLPAAKFIVCAAEDMSTFENERFATVVFWGNGIDEVEHGRRILILKEIIRVLRKGGIFLLSSHNLDWGGLSGLVRSAASSDSLSSRFVGIPRSLWQRLECRVIRSYARFSNRDYGMVPLHWVGLNITTPVYHISSEAQIKQLMKAGFAQIQAFTSGGAALNDPGVHIDHNGPDDYEIYYASRKL